MQLVYTLGQRTGAHIEREAAESLGTRAGREVPIRPIAPGISDPKDQPIIEAAVAAEADAICTSDPHFYQSPAKEFLAERGITVLRDTALLLLLEAEKVR